MTLLERTRIELRQRKGRWRDISQDTGISYGWLRKMAAGETANPGVVQVELLASYFHIHPTNTDAGTGAVDE